MFLDTHQFATYGYKHSVIILMCIMITGGVFIIARMSLYAHPNPPIGTENVSSKYKNINESPEMLCTTIRQRKEG
jgi:hypothetical protein